ncbi:TPA: hypothetical protein DIV55_04220 [Patescibacteria group bacterium]|uniref:Uncharacterized protein n=1 Tax=Candidatus Gottesmanbacteria bacterium GW2011_GWA1_43_11 TaxID=1618436 RepID=A0A0G1CFH3_9BACT|nr:MAG: hypothetical protein UV59_C0017G0008 [Candidatus Gottesmanbacteria bacterium GW2011_GWA1_43_11]HCS78919.1 hypothetical protein [Patescibacteria group bacterium]
MVINALTRLKTAILLLILIGLVVHVNSIFNDFVLGDDTDQIVENLQIRNLVNIPAFFSGSTYFRQESNRAFGLYYKPVMMITYTLIYQIAGADPLLYHLVQVLLFIATSVVLLLLFREFFSPQLAWFLAVVFVVHPANTESVYFAAALQDVLFMLFGTMALLLLVRGQPLATLPKSLLLGILLLTSMFSKETGVAFLLIAGLYVFFFERKFFRRMLQLSLGMFLIYVFFRFGIAHIGFGEQAIARISRAALPVRLMNIPFMLATYALLLVFPAHLEIHQNWLVTSLSTSAVLLPLTLIGVATIALVMLGVKFKQHSRQLFLPFLFFLGWTTVGFVPHLQLIPLDVTLAERWLILPMGGVLGMVGVVVTAGKKRLPPRTILICITSLILIIFSIRTVMRGFNWRSSETLFTHDLQTAQDNYYLENLYASLLLMQGRVAEAEPLVRTSVNGYPFLSNLSNLAIIRLNQGKYDEAETYFEQSLAKEHIYPAVQNYVNFLVFIKKDYGKAKIAIQKYLPNYPGAAYLWMTLALVEHDRGNQTEAVKAALKALSLEQTPIIEEVSRALAAGVEPDVQKYLAP